MTTTSQPQTVDAEKRRHLQELLRQGSGVIKELWSFQTNDWVTSVHAGDIDGDGDLEVIIGSRDGSVSVLTKKGDLKTRATEANREWIGAIYGVDNVKALDNTRIVAGTRNNKVLGLDELGQRIWGYEAEQVIRRVRVEDINHDGKSEVLVGSEDLYLHVLSCETGELLWKFSTNGWVRSVYPIDLDHDGEMEILAASGDQHIYIVSNKGELQRKIPAGGKVHSLYAADLDDDGTVEILVGSDAKDLYAMTPEGEIKWRFSPENRIHSINVADVNKDGHYEIIAGSEDEHVYILDYQGQLLWKHHLRQRIFSVYSVDLNRDGISEIVLGAEDNNVWVLAVELQPDLLARIQAAYQDMGAPHSSSLNLSVRERDLLHDLVDEPEPGEKHYSSMTLASALAIEDPYLALEALLYLQQQHVQVLWKRTDLGHLRVVTIDKVLRKPQRELVVGTGEGQVLVLSAAGELLWSYNIPERVRSLDIGDIDGDGEAELIAGCADGYVYALSSSKPAEKFRSHFIEDWTESIAIIHPSESDRYEMVLGTRQSKEIQIHRGDFVPVSPPFKIEQGVQILVTYDLNRDGEDEILAGFLDKGIYAYTRTGEILWTYQTQDRVKAITVYDIDHDGEVEILVGSEDRNIYVLNEQGKLLWRYDTQHRVLALGVLDINNDGHPEIFVGSGNRWLSVLNHRGDLLWLFQANDRIRTVMTEDINGDGLIEILVGTEDHLYALQYLDPQHLNAAIEERWQKLLAHQSPEQAVKELARHHSSHLRAFALNRQATGKAPFQLSILQELRKDSSLEVRRALSEITPELSHTDKSEVRMILDELAKDRRRAIRLVLVDCLSAISQHNPQIGFEYLERLTRSTDLWVRHSVVRQLDRLFEAYPRQVFALLMKTISDKQDLWMRQEAARVLSHYLDSYPSDLPRALRLLMLKEVDASLWNLVVYCAGTRLVRQTAEMFAHLASELSGKIIQDRLKAAYEALERKEFHNAPYSTVMYQMCRELHILAGMRTIEEAAKYACDINAWIVQWYPEKNEEEGGGEDLLFGQTLQVLHQFNMITDFLRVYLRRSGLGERITSLLEADQAIEGLSNELGPTYFPQQQERFTDYAVLRLILQRWRGIVHTELALIRGRADLVPEIGTHQMVLEKRIVIPLRIENIGRSSAENVTVRLLVPNDEKGFTLVGSNQQHFTIISSTVPVQAEFTLEPHATSLYLTFHITYEDAERKNKERPYGCRLDLVPRQNRIIRLHNPYYTGTAIQDLTMFFGREQEIELLQEDFVYSTAPAVVVLYGQRRSGKSSLIYKLLLSNLLNPHIPARIDMQHVTLNFTVEKFFRDMAYTIYRELVKRGYEGSFPDLGLFKEDATFAFDRFLDEIEGWLNGRKLVLLIDEFEVLDEQAETHQIDQHLFDHLRSLVQERRCLNLLLAGTHSLERLTSAYWSVFFNLAIHRRLAGLAPEAARQLITNPMKEHLEFDHFAVEKIRLLTGDQPYLIQLFCHSLVRHCQAQEKDYITINDVNIVLNEVKESGRQYFHWIWDQASWEEQVVLAIIAQSSGEGEQYVSFNDIERAFQEYHLSYTPESLLGSLRNLRNNDVIADVPNEHRYRIVVGLTHSWLHESKPLQRVILGKE